MTKNKATELLLSEIKEITRMIAMHKKEEKRIKKQMSQFRKKYPMSELYTGKVPAFDDCNRCLKETFKNIAELEKKLLIIKCVALEKCSYQLSKAAKKAGFASNSGYADYLLREKGYDPEQLEELASSVYISAYDKDRHAFYDFDYNNLWDASNINVVNKAFRR